MQTGIATEGLVRPLHGADLKACLGLLPSWLKTDAQQTRLLTRTWTRLLGQPGFHAELAETGDGRRAGLCMALVLDDSWEAQLRDAPPTEPTLALYQALSGGKLVLEGHQRIAEANGRGDICLFILHLEAEDRDTLDRLLLRACRGFHLRRIWAEGPTRHLPLREQGWQAQTVGPERQLFGMSRPRLVAVAPDALLQAAFTFQAPSLHLAPCEMRVLRLAVAGLSDEEISAELGVSARTVLRAWQTASQRVCLRLPELCGNARCMGHMEAATRCRLLAYLANHPEEWRPHRQDAPSAAHQLARWREQVFPIRQSGK